MGRRSAVPALTDVVEAIERIWGVVEGVTLDGFERDWQLQWIVERGVEIVSEASRRLPDDLKARHPAIPWPKVAGIGNVLRHEYHSVSAPVMWKLVREDLRPLLAVCRGELVLVVGRDGRLK